MSTLVQIAILPKQQDDKDFILKAGLKKANLKIITNTKISFENLL